MGTKIKNKRGRCYELGGLISNPNMPTTWGGESRTSTPADAPGQTQGSSPVNIGSIAGLVQGTGILNMNLNPNQDMSTLQGRIDAEGMGSNTGKNPVTKFIDDAFGLTKNQRLNEIEQFGNITATGNTNEDVLKNYSDFNPLQKINYDPSKNIGREIGDSLLATGQGAAAGAQFGPWGALIGGIAGGASNIGSKIFGSDRRDDINRKIEEANINRNISLDQNLEKVNKNNAYNMISSYYAAGGQLGDQLAPGLTAINNGGTHEQNPNGGVPQGVDPQGIPNLVEQGEVKTDGNYIFSDRNKPSLEILKEVGLPSNLKTLSFAKIAKLISKEAFERPNDPISKKGLETQLARLKYAQEMYNQAEFENRMQNDPVFREQVIAQQQAQAQQQQEQQNQQLGGEVEQQPQAQFTGENPNVFDDGSQMNPIKLNRQSNVYDNIYTFDTTKRDQLNAEMKLFAETDPNNPFNDPSNPFNIFKDESAKNNQLYNDVSTKNTSTKDAKKSDFDITSLMYTPAVANAGILGSLLASKPDYSNADAITGMQLDKVSAEPLRDYMKYHPYDTNYALNQLHQQQAASRAGIANNSGGNRATYLAATLGSDYNYGLNEGTMLRQAMEYNDAQKRQVSEFNRGTNQYNSQSKLQADSQNVQAQADLNKIKSQGYLLRQNIKDSRDQDIASAISGTSENLATIGFNQFNMNMANSITSYKVDDNGTVHYYNKKGEEVDLKALPNNNTNVNKKANGGQSKTTKIKINKGLTYEF